LFRHATAIRRAATRFNNSRPLPAHIADVSILPGRQLARHQTLKLALKFGLHTAVSGTSTSGGGMRGAVIGTGIASNAAAWTLSRR
jgi:hypothetical protein